MDLAAHFVALMTLVQTFRGRVNRQSAGRIVFPVLAVKFILELWALKHGINGWLWRWGSWGNYIFATLKAIPWFAKTLVLLMVTGRFAFGNDKSYIAHDEWLPRKRTKTNSC